MKFREPYNKWSADLSLAFGFGFGGATDGELIAAEKSLK